MATIRKTTIRRYNGTDWDSIYLATSSDIVSLGDAITAAEDTTAISYNQVFAANSTVNALLKKVVDRLATYDTATIPNINNGTSITALAANKITGTLANSQLPADVHGNVYEVASEAAKDAQEGLMVGDIVKVAGGAVYGLKAISSNTKTWVKLTDDAAHIDWSMVDNTPTTLDGYGIADAVYANEKVTTASAANRGKILVLNNDGKLDVSITGDAGTLGGHADSYFATAQGLSDVVTAIGDDATAGTIKGRIKAIEDAKTATYNALNLEQVIAGTGTLPLTVIPKGAQERLYEVSAISVLADSSNPGFPSDAGNGDTIQDQTDGKMYYVNDETKLGTANYEQGIKVYTAGSASSVEWANVQNKPTTVATSGLTDAVADGDCVDVASLANAGKVMLVNAQGKLTADITGDAGTLGGHADSYFATAQGLSDVVTAIGDDATAGTIKGRIKAIEDTLGEDGGLEDRIDALETSVGDNTSGSETGIYADIKNLQAGTTITALAASKLTGTVSRANLPADVSGKIITGYATLAAAAAALTTATANKGDLLKLDNGAVYVLNDADPTATANWVEIVNVAGSQIAWNQLTGIPTTIVKSGEAGNGEILLTNAVISSDTSATAAANKLIYTNSDSKLPVSITGDADTVDGFQAADLAKQSWADDVDTALGAENAVKAQRTGLKGDVQTLKEQASLNTILLVDDVSEISDAQVGQLCLVTIA